MSGLLRGLPPLTLALGALALLLLVAGPLACQQYRQRAAEAKLGQAQADAAIRSGREAVETVGRAGRRETASETLTRSNEKEIRNAKGAEVAVGHAGRAGLDGLCRRAAYRHTERCRLREPAPR